MGEKINRAVGVANPGAAIRRPGRQKSANSAVTPPEAPTLGPLGTIAHRSLLHGLLDFLRFGFRLGNRLGSGRGGQAWLLPLLVDGVGRRRRGFLFRWLGCCGERRQRVCGHGQRRPGRIRIRCRGCRCGRSLRGDRWRGWRYGNRGRSHRDNGGWSGWGRGGGNWRARRNRGYGHWRRSRGGDSRGRRWGRRRNSRNWRGPERLALAVQAPSLVAQRACGRRRHDRRRRGFLFGSRGGAAWTGAGATAATPGSPV